MSTEFEKMPVQEQAELLAQQSANEAYLAFEEMMPEFQATMAKAEQEAKPKVHYLMFREVFLPWFAGDENRKYPTVNITHWLSISGNVFQAVDIVDDAGNVIMEVPPYFDRDVLRITDPMGLHRDETGKEHRLLHVWHVVASLRDRAPNQADRILIEEIKDRLQAVGVEQKTIAYAERWNRIYEYYGRHIPFPDVDGVMEYLRTGDNTKLAKPTETTESSTTNSKDTSFTDDPNVDFDWA